VEYTQDGTHNFTAPADGYYEIECVGAGGGGGNQYLGFVAGGGGGGGGYVSGNVYLSQGETLYVTVGAGGLGAGDMSWHDGAEGGASYVLLEGDSESALLHAGGGSGGQGMLGSEGGAGGIGSIFMNSTKSTLARDKVQLLQSFSGGRGGNAYVDYYMNHNGGGGGSAGNTDGPGYDGLSGPDPQGAAAQSGRLTLGAGGRGYSGPSPEISGTAGGTGAGGGGGHDTGGLPGGPGVVRITRSSRQVSLSPCSCFGPSLLLRACAQHVETV
jgi:hypothetical protein